MRALPAARPSRLAAAALALSFAGGCALAPSRWVEARTAPPAAIARGAGRDAPAAPARRAAREATASESGSASESAPASPPEPAAAPPRSLADLVDLALSRDPATRAAWHDARAAAATAGGKRALFLPALDANATLVRTRPSTLPGRPTVVTSSANLSGAITWVLLDLGTRSAQVDEADRLLVAARLGERAAVADLVLAVQQTWFQHLAARALVEAEAAAVRQAETSLAAAEGRRRSGLATVADVLQARTALSQVRLAQQQAEGQALTTRGALATLAGLPPTAALEVGVLPEAVDAAAVQPGIDELLAAAAAQNPDLGRARATASAAAARARWVARSSLPVLSLQASGTRSWFLDPTHDAPLDAWAFGLVLRLPTLDSVRPAYDALAAREAADAARDRADATAQRVSLDVWTSWQGLRTAARRVATARDLLASARASADVATGRYREGVGSIVDLLNAQAALELARAEDVRARTDYLVGLAQLARATGGLELPAAPAPAPEGETPP